MNPMLINPENYVQILTELELTLLPDARLLITRWSYGEPETLFTFEVTQFGANPVFEEVLFQAGYQIPKHESLPWLWSMLADVKGQNSPIQWYQPAVALSIVGEPLDNSGPNPALHYRGDRIRVLPILQPFVG